MVTMETKSAISWVLVPNVSIPNFIHLYTSITELWVIMLLHHFWKCMPCCTVVSMLRLNRMLGCKSSFASFKTGREFPVVNNRAGRL